MLSGPKGSSQSSEGLDDALGPLRQLLVAQSAVVRLKHRTQQQRVDARVLLGIAIDLDRTAGLQLGDSERIDGGGDGVELNGIGQDEGEVALDGLVAGEFAGGGSSQRQRVELGQIELREIDRLA
jgi:hypothetical protein